MENFYTVTVYDERDETESHHSLSQTTEYPALDNELVAVNPESFSENPSQHYIPENATTIVEISDFDPQSMQFVNNQLQKNTPPILLVPQVQSSTSQNPVVTSVSTINSRPLLTAALEGNHESYQDYKKMEAAVQSVPTAAVQSVPTAAPTKSVESPQDVPSVNNSVLETKTPSASTNGKIEKVSEEINQDKTESQEIKDSKPFENSKINDNKAVTPTIKIENDSTFKTCVRCKAMFTSLTDEGVTNCEGDDFTCKSCKESSDSKDLFFNILWGEKNRTINVAEASKKNFSIKLKGLDKSDSDTLTLEISCSSKSEELEISKTDLTNGELSIECERIKQVIPVQSIPPIVCQFPCSDCGDSFPDTQSLADHKLTHPGHKPWVCLECGKEFSYNNLLQRHLLSHTNIREHVCSVCNKAFRTKANMKRHKIAAHKNVQDEADTPKKADKTKKTAIKWNSDNKVEEDIPIPDLPDADDEEYDPMDDLEEDETLEDPMEDDDVNSFPEEEEKYLESIPTRPKSKRPKQSPRKIRHNCKMCPKGFSNKQKWKRHELYHFQLRMPNCEVCGKSFVDKDYLMEHLRTHEDVFMDYICKECGLEFPFKDELQHHILDHASADKKVSSVAKTTQQNDSGQFECTECEKSFRSNYILQRHLESHSRATCQCQECGKFYSCRYNLVQHMMIHNTNSNYICDQCGESFKVKQYLSRHMIKHREQKTWACNLCDLKFYRQGNLRHHMKQHVEIKPYQCQHCQKSFVRERTLEEHILLAHTKERPFQCPICGRGFGLARMIKPHMKIHSGEKEHKCEECGKLFTYKSNLNQHMMVHSGEKPFICQYCGKGFARNKYLNDHMRTHAGELCFS